MTPTRLATLSLGVGLGVFGLKWLAYRLTGSVALYSDALESIVNVVAAAAALYALWVSQRPADEGHPFGHTKAEYFSAVLEGVLIALAALAIVREALPRLLQPHPPEQLGLGLAVSLGASVINGGLAWLLLGRGRVLKSPALIADGQHLWSDVLTSVGVLVGVGLGWASGRWLLDPLLAILVALNILRIGWRLVRDSVGGLMDQALPVSEVEVIRTVLTGALKIQAQQGQVLEVHDLRTRQAGPRTFIEFHLVVPGLLSVSAAHGICDQLESLLRSERPEAQVIIHVEPEEKAKNRGFLVG
jgi:cation diffusion facilitator family transporter